MGGENPEPLTPPGAPPPRGAPPLAARLGLLGIASAALSLGAVYIKSPLPRAGVTIGDLIDALTPFILVALYAAVGRALFVPTTGYRPDSPRVLHAGIRILLTFAGALLIFGHGVHVAANSIHDMLARAGLPDSGGLVYWWDERVSHYLIDSAKVGICVGLSALERRSPAPVKRAGAGEARVLYALGALAYGFIFFADGVEGQTTPLLLPFSAAYLGWAVLRGRSDALRAAGAPGSAVRRFFAAGAAVSLVLFAIWGVWHRGFPEFSAVGLIP